MTDQANLPENPAPSLPSEADDLLLAAMAIFEEGKNTFTTSTGRVVVIKAATMESLSLVMEFFKLVAGALENHQMATLIDLVSDEQKKLMAQGIDPRKVSLENLASADLVSKAYNNISIISVLMAALFDHLPKFATAFTDLSEEEYRKLSYDEGVLTIMGIFVLNYHFFTRRLLPMFVGFIRSMVSANQKLLEAEQKKTQGSGAKPSGANRKRK